MLLNMDHVQYVMVEILTSFKEKSPKKMKKIRSQPISFSIHL